MLPIIAGAAIGGYALLRTIEAGVRHFRNRKADEVAKTRKPRAKRTKKAISEGAALLRESAAIEAELDDLAGALGDERARERASTKGAVALRKETAELSGTAPEASEEVVEASGEERRIPRRAKPSRTSKKPQTLQEQLLASMPNATALLGGA